MPSLLLHLAPGRRQEAWQDTSSASFPLEPPASSPAFSPPSLRLREQGASVSLGWKQEEVDGNMQRPGGEGTSHYHHCRRLTSRLVKFCSCL